jgi:hypothetical protein
MLEWLRRAPPVPAPSPANPGRGPLAEGIDLVRELAAVLSARGIRTRRDPDWLRLRGGLVLRPQIVHVTKGEGRGDVQTATTIEVWHPRRISTGAFEYQHAQGGSAAGSIRDGFEGFADLDLPVLLDLLGRKECETLILSMKFPDGRKRRAWLGPPAHLQAAPVAEDNEHAFCACCLFTNAVEAFRTQIETDGFYAIRLFAARSSEGEAMADCRVNGEDFEPGAEALRRYAATWPARGFEMRKQYMVLDRPEAGD